MFVRLIQLIAVQEHVVVTIVLVVKAQVVSVIHLDNSFAVLPILLLNQPTPFRPSPHPRRR
jgi:hypothetical protein